ncbi:MAG: hypothetical protein L3J41_13050 [Melioribacteraceae bacterium]|nr:hypothetical protein [Melioribacteraceae bacterium]
MKLKLLALLLITSLIFLNCSEPEIKNINLKDAIFRAEGNNPAWKLEIDSNNGIHFYSNTKLEKIVTPSSTLVEIINVATTNYNAETESAQIKIEIFKKQCIDSEEYKEFKYEVRVQAKNTADDDFQLFKGCGEFLANKN